MARHLDVPYVPTPMAVVDAMLDLAKVTKSDVVYDLGCGDGRIVVRAATRFGCRGVGVDLNPERVKEARLTHARANVTELTRFEVGDVFEFDFSPAQRGHDVSAAERQPEAAAPIVEGAQSRAPRLVSHDFHMGDWAAQRHARSRAQPHLSVDHRGAQLAAR